MQLLGLGTSRSGCARSRGSPRLPRNRSCRGRPAWQGQHDEHRVRRRPGPRSPGRTRPPGVRSRTPRSRGSRWSASSAPSLLAVLAAAILATATDLETHPGPGRPGGRALRDRAPGHGGLEVVPPRGRPGARTRSPCASPSGDGPSTAGALATSRVLVVLAAGVLVAWVTVGAAARRRRTALAARAGRWHRWVADRRRWRVEGRTGRGVQRLEVPAQPRGRHGLDDHAASVHPGLGRADRRCRGSVGAVDRDLQDLLHRRAPSRQVRRQADASRLTSSATVASSCTRVSTCAWPASPA